MRDKEKENNQPEAGIEPPILGCLLGSLIAYLVCYLFRQTSSLRDLGDSYYGVCITLDQARNYKSASSENDTLPCASTSARESKGERRRSTSREYATSTYGAKKASENDTTLQYLEVSELLSGLDLASPQPRSFPHSGT